MEFITPIEVKPCHTLVLLTTEEVLVLQHDGNWTRTPLPAPQTSTLPSLQEKRLIVPQYVQQFGRLADAQKEFQIELDRIAPPYCWHRKGGEGCQ
jgi:hypothetical protein